MNTQMRRTSYPQGEYMKKTHYENILSKFPQIRDTQFKFSDHHSCKNCTHESPVGVVYRISAIEDHYKKNPLMSTDKTEGLVERVAAHMSVFRNDGEHIYKMGREFSEILTKLKLDIPAKYLPKNNRLECIEFADHQRFALNGLYAHCVYVYVTDESIITSRGTDAKNLLTILIPLFDESGNLDTKIDLFSVPFESLDQTFEDAMLKANQFSTSAGNLNLIRFVLNAYIYIHNDGEPDLRAYRAQRPPESRKPKRHR